MSRKVMPDAVGPQTLSTLSPGDHVIDAVRVMRDRGIGALPITENGALAGIVTERDMVFRVLANELDPAVTPIAEIMTADPETIEPGADIMHALERMQAGNFRHLPIVEDGTLIGIVSIRDIYASLRAELEEAVLEREAFLTSAWTDDD